MSTNEIKDTLKRLEQLMYGFNYQVTFGIDIFESGITIDNISNKLKRIYSANLHSEAKITLFSKIEFWEEINFGLTYRGDNTSGLMLSPKKEEKLLIEQMKYKVFIQDYISDNTKIYSYYCEHEMPSYSIYWEYNFILLNEDRYSLFIYGSSSD